MSKGPRERRRERLGAAPGSAAELLVRAFPAVEQMVVEAIYKVGYRRPVVLVLDPASAAARAAAVRFGQGDRMASAASSDIIIATAEHDEMLEVLRAGYTLDVLAGILHHVGPRDPWAFVISRHGTHTRRLVVTEHPVHTAN